MDAVGAGYRLRCAQGGVTGTVSSRPVKGLRVNGLGLGRAAESWIAAGNLGAVADVGAEPISPTLLAVTSVSTIANTAAPMVVATAVGRWGR